MAAEGTERRRAAPNVLVTGTPGTGKTTLCELIAESVPGFRHLNVGQVAREQGCFAERDEEWDAAVLDEDRLLDVMEPMLQDGGCVVDFHSCEMFPERWFDLVLVLRTDNTLLYDRLQARGYSEHKVRENVECEIMQVLLEEARESYASEIVHELQSNSTDDMDANLERVVLWHTQWLQDNNGTEKR